MSLNLQITPVAPDGQMLKTPAGVIPGSLYLVYSVNEIPRVKISVSVDKDKIYNYKEYKCLAKLDEGNYLIEFDFYVEHINEVNTSTTILTGLMCNYKQATEYKSVSLGNTIADAIDSLGFSRKYKSFDKESINFNYFQFNETANDALLKIFVGNSPYSYGYLTEKSIGTKTFKDFDKLDKGSFFSYELGSTNSTIYVGNPYNVSTELRNKEIEFKSVLKEESAKYKIHQSAINGDSIIYNEQCPQELNALQNRRFMGTLNKSIEVSLSSPIPNYPNIGDVIMCKGFEPFDTSNEGFPALITKYIIYSNAEITNYTYRFERA